MARKFRGSGVRHTLPYLGPFAGLWVLVTLAAVAVAAISSYLMIEAARASDDASVAGMLLLQTVLIAVAVVGLGVFTTHRLAGPWIAVRRALDQVRGGDLDTQLRIRSLDAHLREVERSFNDMMAALRDRVGERRSA
jgi:nitrogen fixation/metabolism regulation signal transduction histidine kinase